MAPILKSSDIGNPVEYYQQTLLELTLSKGNIFVNVNLFIGSFIFSP